VTESPKAVFLSYASEDGDPAKRISEALRRAGIDVWFGQNELRGGDVWDRRIRTQIRTCRLFLPIISSHTEARAEGYFRREWKLAVERTHDLSERVAFLVPIVIDATPESKADVPEAFRTVQWTRIPLGEPSAAFIARISALIQGEHAAAREVEPKRQRNDGPPPPLRRPMFLWAALVIAACVLAAGGRYLGNRPPRAALTG
jgi:hypothetical protein